MSKETNLRVKTLDRIPMYGIGGPIKNVWDATPSATPGMLVDETQNAHCEWEDYQKRVEDIRAYRDFVANDDPETVHDMQVELEQQRKKLAEGLAGVIMSACTLAMLCGVDLQGALDLHAAELEEKGYVNG